MSWESVKAFCRRRTQNFNEQFRKDQVVVTKDEKVERTAKYVNTIKSINARTANRMQKISANFGENLAMLHAMQEDYASLEHADFTEFAKKIQLVTNDLRQKHIALQAGFDTATTPMTSLVSDAGQLDKLMEDRNTKKLELDFFINKVNGLKAKPPSDGSRLPRNEARVEEWRKIFEEANAKVEVMSQNLISAGEKNLRTGATACVNELNKYTADSAGTWRALFPPGSQVMASGGSVVENVASLASGALKSVGVAASAAAASSVANNVNPLPSQPLNLGQRTQSQTQSAPSQGQGFQATSSSQSNFNQQSSSSQSNFNQQQQASGPGSPPAPQQQAAAPPPPARRNKFVADPNDDPFKV